MTTGVTGCDKQKDTDRDEKKIATATPPNVEDVVETPSSFYGKTVTLHGEVDTVFSNRAFELEGNDWIFDHEILVVTRSPIYLGPQPLEDDDEVVVTGTIERLTTTDFERKVGWDSKVEIEIEIEEYPVLVADSIHAADYVARWSEKEADEGVILSDSVPRGTRLAESLMGRKAEFAAITVQTKAGKGLWVGSSHQMQTFVNVPEGFDTASVSPGDVVALKGTFRMMPATDTAMSRWEFDPSLRPQVEQEMLYIDANSLQKIESKPAAPVTLAQVIEKPSDHAGRVIRGQAKVSAVPSDRGFWLDAEDGKKIFAVIHEKDPENNRIDINAGNTVKFAGLALMPQRSADLLLPLEDDAKSAIEASGVFLTIHWSDIEKVDKE